MICNLVSLRTKAPQKVSILWLFTGSRIINQSSFCCCPRCCCSIKSVLLRVHAGSYNTDLLILHKTDYSPKSDLPIRNSTTNFCFSNIPKFKLWKNLLNFTFLDLGAKIQSMGGKIIRTVNYLFNDQALIRNCALIEITKIIMNFRHEKPWVLGAKIQTVQITNVNIAELRSTSRKPWK